MGYEVDFQFPIVKLLDYKDKWEELENSSNPFATVVMAHLKTKETRKDFSERRQWKLFITTGLYAQGYQKQDIINLFHFIDWVMRLPEDLEENFLEDLEQYEEKDKMRYVTSVERIGIKKGIQQGLVSAIELGLELKFGAVGLELLPEISPIQDIEVLTAIKDGIKTATTLAELRSYYQ